MKVDFEAFISHKNPNARVKRLPLEGVGAFVKLHYVKDMELSQYLQEHYVPFEQNVPLSKKTWIKTGGICALWVTPKTIEQLTQCCQYLYAQQITYDIIGQTSNIFFHSTYNPQVVVSTVKVNQYEMKDDFIVCDCGVPVAKLAKECLALGLAGFYGLVGLPGTVASAVVNNASCFECSISSMLVSAEVLTPDGIVRTVLKEDFGYSHRSSAFKRREKKGIVLSVKLKVEKAESVEEEYQKSEKTVVYRRDKQEHSGRTLGSVFASRSLRKTLRNYLLKAVMRVFPKISRKTPQFIQKKTILFLYGYKDLNNYVSDRQINTFIWDDENAESAFGRYKEMMNKVYDNVQLEIEEKK